jgi:CcmD family protein
MIKKTLATCSFLFFALILRAQENNGVEMADEMRRNGKIYVVVAVLLVIFAGLVLYLIRLDRKISKLEKNIHSKF